MPLDDSLADSLSATFSSTTLDRNIQTKLKWSDRSILIHRMLCAIVVLCLAIMQNGLTILPQRSVHGRPFRFSQSGGQDRRADHR